MISTQEIKEAIKEIAQATIKDEEHIKNIQEIFELNPWLLEKLTDEKLKTEYIRLLYSREHLTDAFLNASKEKYSLSKENEILGKMALEIVLKYSKKSYPSEVKSDLEIFRLLCGKDWKEKTEFSVDEKGVSWKGVHHYQAKPQEIVENYYFKQWEENEKHLAKKEEKIKIFEEIMLKEEDVSNQISLLNKLYKDEVEDLKYLVGAYTKEHKEKVLDGLLLEKNKDEVKKLEKELEEKKELIKKLEERQSNQLIAQQEQKIK